MLPGVRALRRWGRVLRHGLHLLRHRRSALLRDGPVRERRALRLGRLRPVRRRRPTVLRGRRLLHGRVHRRRVRRVRRARGAMLRERRVQRRICLRRRHLRRVRGTRPALLRGRQLQHGQHLQRGRLRGVRRQRRALLRTGLRQRTDLLQRAVRAVRRGGSAVLPHALLQHGNDLHRRAMRELRRQRTTVLRWQHLRRHRQPMRDRGLRGWDLPTRGLPRRHAGRPRGLAPLLRRRPGRHRDEPLALRGLQHGLRDRDLRGRVGDPLRRRRAVTTDRFARARRASRTPSLAGSAAS